jgi:putative membrane protein
MSSSKRLHPISAVYELLKMLKELIIPILFFLFVGEDGTTWDKISFWASMVIIVFVFASGILKWLRFTYRVEEGEIRIESGAIIRTKRYIPLERIQSLSYTEGILHRPFGLVKVKIETASAGAEAEAELTAITKEDAEELQRIIASQKEHAQSETNTGEETKKLENDSTIVYQMTPKELLIMASTSSALGVILSAFFALYTQVEQFLPLDWLYDELEQLVRSGLVILAIISILGLVSAWAFGIVLTFLKYGNFTVKKERNDVIISRGLLEKVSITIPIERVQGVVFVEGILRQPFGFTSVKLESAGGEGNEKDQTEKVMILPFIHKKRVVPILQQLLPDYEFDVPLQAVSVKAKRRYMIREVFKTVPFVIALSTIFWPYGLFSLLLLVLAGGFGYLKYKDAGWHVTATQLTTRTRVLARQTFFMKKNRIQSMELKQGWLQRRKELVSVTSTIRSGVLAEVGKVVDMEMEDGFYVYEWYRPRKELPEYELEEPHFKIGDEQKS